MNQEKIGQFIKKIREENKLTQKELADKLGVTYQAVSKWENGKNVPDISIIKEMSKMFNIDIDEILDGEKKDKKKNLYPLLLVVLLIVLLIVGYILYGKSSDYEFKTITTTCSDFKISGSAAYNSDKATIYISNVEFCGKEDTAKYKSITCTLYETYNDTKTKISTCDKKKNTNLEDFLKELQVNTNHSSKTCKNLSKSSLTLEIEAKDDNNKTITYTIPIKLNDSCK
ncbi:MAG: helix-turn-helix transcriptional regulator [Bacilli bacterium]|nr:helix-turn-helix transcriptional regulator [Bacilli bacterium]